MPREYHVNLRPDDWELRCDRIRLYGEEITAPCPRILLHKIDSRFTRPSRVFRTSPSCIFINL
ncbi:hypothetical protein M408DRAFT_327100 [Serendipita vermifera MAFF 305830]|uniref:Uncharacterized protein n=1 Tax=Serendipita vermifera MAFF 305830 TaxID=933852 RepID=A0A0C3B482_SERVB|nr:hypothetical protein M408DRAFT_327100 [Serendipita vermifera MAFF 305830]